MAIYKPEENETDLVKYLRFLAKITEEAIPKANSKLLKRYLSEDSKIFENSADLLAAEEFLKRSCPEALYSLRIEHGDVYPFLLGTAIMKLSLLNSNIPQEDKKLILQIDEKAEECYKRLGCPPLYKGNPFK